MSVVLERRLSQGSDPRALPERRLRSASAARSRSTASPKRRGCSSARTSRNLTLAEAATIAGVIQSPPRLSPFNNPERAKERRNVVLRAMADTGFISADAAERAAREPVQIVARALEAEAPYFVDYISQELQDEIQRGRRHGRRLHDARPAPAAPRAGRGARRADPGRRDPGQAQAPARAGGAHRRRSAHRRGPRAGRRPLLQPVAVQPRDQRAPAAGLGVQAVRLPRRVRARRRRKAAPTSRRRRSCIDEPTTFTFNDADVDAGQLRRRVRRPDHAAARAGAVAQHRHGQGRRDGRLRARSPRCGAGSAPARRRGPIRRSRSASSKRRRSRSPPPTRCSRTAARSGRCARSRASSAAARTCRSRPAAAEDGGAAGHDLPRDQHDAQRASTRAPAPARGPPASRSTPPASPARPTTCATPGSSASRRSS